MDLGRELDEIGAFLDTSGFPWAVVGGVALAAYGHPRMAGDPSATDLHLLDLERDLPTTADDVHVLRALARQVSTWFHLTPQKIEALIPAGVLERRPPTPDGRPPFSLDETPDEPTSSDA